MPAVLAPIIAAFPTIAIIAVVVYVLWIIFQNVQVSIPLDAASNYIPPDWVELDENGNRKNKRGDLVLRERKKGIN